MVAEVYLIKLLANEYVKSHIKRRTTMTRRQAKIQEDTHFWIMRILQENPDLTQRELAEKLGMNVLRLNTASTISSKSLCKNEDLQN